jgi:hypothetical protein
LTDQNNCTKTGSFVIVNPAELTIKKLDSRNVTCNDNGDGWIELEVTGGTGDYSFRKNEGEAVTNDVEKVTSSTYKLIKLAGTYDYTPVVLDENGCSKTLDETVTIVNPDPIEIVSIDWGVKKCYGDNDDVTTIHIKGGTPGYYYSLNNGENYGDLNDSIFTNLEVGNKYPRVKDKNGCETDKSDPQLFKMPDRLEISYKLKGIDCFYDEDKCSLTLKITGGTGPYSLSTNDETFGSSATTRIIRSNTDTTTYLNNKLKTEQEYQFFLKDSNNCHIENIARVSDITDYFADTTFYKPLELKLDSVTPHPVFCGNSKAGRIDFVASGGTAPNKYKDWKLTAIPQNKPDVQYLNKGIDEIEGLAAGSYYLILTDAKGCIATSNIGSESYTDATTIDAENKEIVVTVSHLDSITCNQTKDGSMSITVQNFLENGFFWEAHIWEGDTVPSTRPYTVTDTGYIAADPLYRTGYKDHYVYSAYSQKILKDIGIGIYEIIVTDSLTGCQAPVLDTILYSVNGDSCPPLNFYNVFNQYNGGDTYNDWKLGGTQSLIYNLKIYSAWGELVYDSNNDNKDHKTTAADKYGIRWDGLDNKKRPVPAGTYIYLLRIGVAPNDTLLNGNVTILRNNGR